MPGIATNDYGLFVGDSAQYLKYANGVLTIAGDGSGLTSIDGGNIQTNTITATQIAAGTITTTQLNANAINGMTITGSILRTAASGARTEMNHSNLFGLGFGGIGGYNGSAVQWYGKATDGKLYAGGGNVVLDANGLKIITSTAASDPTRMITFGESGYERLTIASYTNTAGIINTIQTIGGVYAGAERPGITSLVTNSGVNSETKIVSYSGAAQAFVLASASHGAGSFLQLYSETYIRAYSQIYADRGIYAGRQVAPGAGNVAYTGALKSYKNSTEYTGYIFVPLASQLTGTWNAKSISTMSKTLIDLSADFGVPAGIKAVMMRIFARDSGSAGTDCWFGLSPNNTAFTIAGAVTLYGQVNDKYVEVQVIVPCNVNGDVYYQSNASGTNTMDVNIQIWGYWI